MADVAAHAAIIAQAIKASGVLVKVEAPEFQRLVNQQPDALVVRAQRGVFKKYWRYLMGYKGLAFFTDTPDVLPLPSRAQLLEAKDVWIPG